MKTRLIPKGQQLEAPGDYTLDREAGEIVIWLPTLKPENGIVRLPIDPTNLPHWKISGTDERPTLEPSILSTDGQGGRWHGYLRDGQLIAC